MKDVTVFDGIVKQTEDIERGMEEEEFVVGGSRVCEIVLFWKHWA